MKAQKVINVVVAIALFAISYGAVRFIFMDRTPVELQGLSYTRDTYVSSCAYWAKQEPEAKDLSDAFINTYCGCVYDDGVALYGKEKFTKVDQELTSTGVVSPEVNELINTCVTKTLNSGAM